MSDKPVLETKELFDFYGKFCYYVGEIGARLVVDDLARFYPDTYTSLEQEVERRLRHKKLGVLLSEP